MSKTVFFISIILFFLGEGLFARAEGVGPVSPLSGNEEVTNFIELLYNYDFNGARLCLDQSVLSGVDHPVDYVMEVQYYWWMIVSGEQGEINYKKCESYIDSALNYIQSQPDEFNDPQWSFLAASVLSTKFRLKMMQEEQVSALKVLHKIGSYSEVILKNYQTYSYFKLPAAIYHFSVCAAIEKYPFAKVCLIMYPDADKEVGKRLLEANLESNDILIRTESLYFLMRYYLELEQNYIIALNYAEELISMYPENILYQYFRVKILSLSKPDELDEAIKLFKLKVRMVPGLSEIQKSHFEMIVQKEITENL